MRTAQETCDELQKMPHCNAQKLSDLSEQYMMLVQDAVRRIKPHSSYINRRAADQNDAYRLQLESDIDEASLAISSVLK
jgi:hypothetical protein